MARYRTAHRKEQEACASFNTLYTYTPEELRKSRIDFIGTLTTAATT